MRESLDRETSVFYSDDVRKLQASSLFFIVSHLSHEWDAKIPSKITILILKRELPFVLSG